MAQYTFLSFLRKFFLFRADSSSSFAIFPRIKIYVDSDLCVFDVIDAFCSPLSSLFTEPSAMRSSVLRHLTKKFGLERKRRKNKNVSACFVVSPTMDRSNKKLFLPERTYMSTHRSSEALLRCVATNESVCLNPNNRTNLPVSIEITPTTMILLPLKKHCLTSS